MSSSTSSQGIRFSQFPPLFYASLGALVALLITAYVLLERSSQKKIELVDEFGTAVVELAARDLVDAAVNEDLISMHAVLQALVAQPRVVMAKVRSVEQQLLVQAGQTQGLANWQEYSAAITTEDSVHGYVNISLATGFPGDDAVLWTLAATSFLLILMLLVTLYESRGKAWAIAASSENPESDDEQYEPWDEAAFADTDAEPSWSAAPSDTALDDSEATIAAQHHEPEPWDYSEGLTAESEGLDIGADAGEELTDPRGFVPAAFSDEAPLGSADPAESESAALTNQPEVAQPPAASTDSGAMTSDLIVVLANFVRLQEQMNGERFYALVNEFERSLSEVLSLYGGQQLGEPHKQHIYCIRFNSAESIAEAAFRAACSAHLIEQLNQQNPVRFNLVAEICHPDEDIKLALNKLGVFLHPALWDELLERRLQASAQADGRYQLQGFKAPFASLLERQEAQLLAPA